MKLPEAAPQPGSWLGLNLAKMHEIANHGLANTIKLGKLASDRPRSDNTRTKILTDLDNLLTMFSIDTHAWQDKASKLIWDNAYPVTVQTEDVKKLCAGQSIGEAITELAYMNLRIENEEEGHGTIALTIDLTDKLSAVLYAHGSHWSGRHYRDPGSGDILSESWHDERIDELKRTIGEAALDKCLEEYEVASENEFEVYFQTK